MRILMFGWEFPPHNSGGLGTACEGLTSALCKKEDVELIFVLPREMEINEHDFKTVFADIGNVKIKYVDSLLMPYLSSKAYLERYKNSKYRKAYGETLYEEVERYALAASGIATSENPDIIHAHDWLAFGAGLAAKEATEKPFVAHVHATEFDRTGYANGFVFEKEREGVAGADRVIAVSDYTKQVLHKHYDVNLGKISVVHNGIDMGKQKENISEYEGLMAYKKLGYKIVLFLGRITLQKGPDYFVKAAAKVLEYNPKVLFVIVGSGDMESQIMNMVAGMGISNKFMFTGFLRGERKNQAYKTADLFVMPSVSEPFGLVPLEALFYKTPVLVSRQSGVSEVVQHALKVDFWDVNDMADKTLSALEHKSMRKVLSQNGRREASMCTWDKAAGKCIEIYKQLVPNS